MLLRMTTAVTFVMDGRLAAAIAARYAENST
jgi:hypothetical protein